MDNIEELSHLSRKLDQKSDILNTTIISINERLAKLNLGVEAWLTRSAIERSDPYYDYEKDPSGNFPLHQETWLGYCRFDESHESGWALAAKTVVLQQVEGAEERIVAAETKPLSNTSREIRLEAMKLIPGLLDAIKEKAEELLESIDKAEKAAQVLTGETLKFSLRKIASVRRGSFAGSGETFQYEVQGLPSGQKAYIANMGRGRNQPRWQILRAVNGSQGHWSGEHETATHALAALQREVELESMVE